MKRSLTVVLSVLVFTIAGIGVGWATAPDGDRDPAALATNPWLTGQAGEFIPATPTSVLTGDAVRVFGADRYETAVAISQAAAWDATNTGIVFLVSGVSFPDALAGGASTLFAGPILLTQPTSLPPVTLAEITRLQPCRVYVFGGPNAVSDAVMNQAQGPADGTQEKCP